MNKNYSSSMITLGKIMLLLILQLFPIILLGPKTLLFIISY
jgi:hypothetical protein